MKIIEIIIDSKGGTRLQTKGFVGTSCKDASRALEQALGIVQTDTPTAELYATQQNRQRQQQRS